MKREFFIIFLGFVLLIISCGDKTLVLQDYMITGQKTGDGIRYVDLKDIYCTVNDPWTDTDTTIKLDLNDDGDHDFEIHVATSYPGMLGAGFDEISISPLGQNKVCILPFPLPDTSAWSCPPSSLDWLDTLSVNDTISTGCNWSNDGALVYRFSWILYECMSAEGLWRNPGTAQRRYIGFSIIKGDKIYYGWMGTSDSNIITDYAITAEYEE